MQHTLHMYEVLAASQIRKRRVPASVEMASCTNTLQTICPHSTIRQLTFCLLAGAPVLGHPEGEWTNLLQFSVQQLPPQQRSHFCFSSAMSNTSFLLVAGVPVPGHTEGGVDQPVPVYLRQGAAGGQPGGGGARAWRRRPHPGPRPRRRRGHRCGTRPYMSNA